jgi:hypothetical protein
MLAALAAAAACALPAAAEKWRCEIQVKPEPALECRSTAMPRPAAGPTAAPLWSGAALDSPDDDPLMIPLLIAPVDMAHVDALARDALCGTRRDCSVRIAGPVLARARLP